MSKYAGIKVTPSRERIFEILRKPLITEKTTRVSEFNQVAFQVPLDATKPEIKAAVEDLFKVKVTAVNTSRHRGKLKRFRWHIGRQMRTKKAFVTLAEGQSIDITTGV